MRAGSPRSLDEIITDLQRRLGTNAIQLLSQARKDTATAISTGFDELDTALGIGGIPVSGITEMSGSFTSGMTTLMLCILKNAQDNHHVVVYIDHSATFDVDYAARRGIDLKRLLLVHPQSASEALNMAFDLTMSGAVRLIVLDLTPNVAEMGAFLIGNALSHWRRIVSATRRQVSGVLVLMPHESVSHHVISQHALVRLKVDYTHWRRHRQQVTGLQARVLILKNRLAAPGQMAHIVIDFDESLA